MSEDIVDRPRAVPGTVSDDEIDDFLQLAVEDEAVPCVAAMATNAEGPIYAGAFGTCSSDGSARLTLDSVFWIASMTKIVTSVAAMQLVEQGKLELDRPAAELVPDLASPQVLEGFAEDGQPLLRPAKRPITLRHLLTHTAGYCYAFLDAQLLQYIQQQEVPDITTCTNEALKLPLSFDPGERWHYGISTDWVGKMVEAASGQLLDDYFRENIFGPLGMNDTGFILNSSQNERVVAMRSRLPDGSLSEVPFGLPQEPEFFMGGGGLYGTPRDYLTFLRMLLNNGTLNGVSILDQDTVRLMQENHIGDLEAGKLKSSIPELTHDVDFFPGMSQKWGLGFLINTEASPHGRSAGSLAWAGLGNTYFWIDPTREVAGLIMTQILPFGDPTTLNLYNRFESAIYRRLIT